MGRAKTVFMFSGQGSQYFQMGRLLFDENVVFRECMIRLDDVVRRLSGNSVIDTIYSARNAKSAVFDRTLLSHPAIFMVEYSLAQSLMHANILPDITLGQSLGSFAAATIAGFINVEDALTAVIEQATAIEANCEPGGMLAVMAEPDIFEEEVLRLHSELAGINLSTHFVVSSSATHLVQIEAALKQCRVLYQRLPVAFAFHSRWMDAAQARFGAFMRSIQVEQSHLPMVCCAHAATLSHLPADYFWRAVRDPFQFRRAILNLESAQDGVYRYVDVGPAGTLATFLKYALPKSSKSCAYATLTPFGEHNANLALLAASRASG